MTTITAVPDTTTDAPPFVLTGVRAVLTNPVGYRRREWTLVSVPFGSLTAQRLLFVTDRGLRLRALRCDDIATHSTIYRVFTPYDGLQSVRGEFAIPTEQPELDRFKMHPWCGDAPEKMIPKMELRMRTGAHTVTYRTNEPFELFQIEFSNDCMLRVHFLSRFGNSGFLMEGFATFYDNSPIIDLRIAFIWSDRTNPSNDQVIEGLFFLSGEPVVFDYAVMRGSHQLPVWNGQFWVSQITSTIGFADGSGLPLIGRMLCFPEGATSLPSYDTLTYDDTDPTAQVRQDIETIIAAANAPTYGLCVPQTWDGKMLAHRNLPRFSVPFETIEARADQRMDQFFASTLNTARDFYAIPFIGIGKNPGQTGDQQDFGSAKGWEATVAGDSRWLHYALYSVVCDFFRGVLHYEPNGTRLDPFAHPDWVTWSGKTHYHTGVSPDRLGKESGVWGAGELTGYWGYDLQHRSQTNLATLYALTGDPMLRFIIEHYSTTDVAEVRHRRNFGIDSPRGVGRPAHCFANFMMLSPVGSVAHTRYRDILNRLATLTLQNWRGDAAPGPVDIVAYGTDPRMGITHNGVVLPAWSCWEHSLFVVGTYAAWKATRDPRWLELTRRVSRTVVNYALFKDSLGWSFCTTVHYPLPGVGPTGVAEGEPVPAQWYARTSTLVTAGSGGGLQTWTQNAILIFIETHEANDPDMARAQEIASVFVPGNPIDDRTAEWQACVKSNPAVPGAWASY